MIHAEKSSLVGQTIKIKKDVMHPQVLDFGGSDFVVEDWWDRVANKSWMICDGNPACTVYAIRTGFTMSEVPTDNEVLYGKVGCFGHLVHISELETAEG